MRALNRPVLFLCALLGGAATFAAPADRLYINAAIYTAEPAAPYAEAIAIRDDRILAVGSREQVAKAVAAGTSAVDLGGTFLMPGLIDSHVHAVMGGQTLIGADVDNKAGSVAVLADFAETSLREGRGVMGDILVVTGVPLAIWSDKADLDAQFNGPRFAGKAILLRGMDGHTAWANDVVLARAGIDAALLRSLDATALSYYGHDAALVPDGFLVDAGTARVDALLPDMSAAQMLEAGRAAVGYMHRAGITAWLDPLATDSVLDTYRALATQGELGAQVVALPLIDLKKGDARGQLDRAIALRRTYRDVPGLHVSGIKVFADGVVEYPSQTAVLTQPYVPGGNNGELLFDPAEFARITVAADKAKLIVHVHAIGDLAVRRALDGIEAARKANPRSRMPHSITHLQVVQPEDARRFAPLGVIASFQLLWARADRTTVELMKPYVAPAVYRWQYPARDVLDAGGMIAGASDWPVSTANVFQAIATAETRLGPEGVLDATQRMPREAMLLAYTRNAARALDLGGEIGSLAPGKRADLVAVDRDLLTVSPAELRDARVLWTVSGGRTVFGAEPVASR